MIIIIISILNNIKMQFMVRTMAHSALVNIIKKMLTKKIKKVQKRKKRDFLIYLSDYIIFKFIRLLE